MKNTIKTISLLALLLTSCSATNPVAEEGKAVVRIKTDIGSFIKPTTLSGVADENNTGDKIWAFIFENDIMSLIEEVTIAPAATAQVDIVVEPTNNPVKIILLANAPDYFLDADGGVKAFIKENLELYPTYQEFKSQVNTLSLDAPVTAVPYTSQRIPMSGELYFADGIAADSFNEKSLRLKRIVAKITVESLLAPSDFELLGASVSNAPRGGSLMPPSEYKDNSGNLTYYSYDDIVCTASGQTTASNPIYIYESRADQGTALVIKAKYRGVEYFYKLAMTTDYDNKAGSRNFYYRNYHYKFIVSAVEGIGYSTFEEAKSRDVSNNIIARVDVTDLTSHDITDNGEYFLSLSNSEYVLYAQGEVDDLHAFTLNTSSAEECGIVSLSPSKVEILTPVVLGEVRIKVKNEMAVNERVELRVTVGNLSKNVTVRRAGDHLTRTGTLQRISDFSGSEYKAALIEQQELGWIKLGTTSGVNLTTGFSEGVSEGGFYICHNVNIDTREPSVDIYFARNDGRGRVKAHFELR
ncbi:hypothetical protein BN938_1626 [Mucinivorans hirudinis]|uniref:Major fimbrial subunit protein N-terminal domain-containing protein n=1 Tax=Mucinivorans hirudinis TaxID=1433126 RepID=A0A060R8B5_9BACT|nr:hypothetical protein BN938_1626 [Mucinivorans hirudinis]